MCQPGLMVGTPPSLEIIGLVPRKSQVSASSNITSPPSQRPWSEGAMILPGWSMVPQPKDMGEPSSCMNESVSIETGGPRA